MPALIKVAAGLLLATTAAAHLAWMSGPRRSRQRWAATAMLLVIAAPLPLIYGRWGYMTIRCGREPVAITNFAAAHTYWLPGDAGYRPGDLFQGYVCSEATAKERGYVRSAP